MSSLTPDNNKINKIDFSNNIQDKEPNIINDKTKISTEYHPLEFYALGKKNINMNNNISTFYNKTSSPHIRVNKSSHDLFDRNLLSINSSYFDNSKKVKNIVSLNVLNKYENNYLNPLLIIKNRIEEKKEDQKKNNINSLEWFNLIRGKLFSIDINSKVKNGKNVSRNYFYELKNKISLPSNKNQDNKSFDNCNNDNNLKQTEDKNANLTNNNSEGYDYNFNTNKSVEKIFGCKRFKKDNDNLNKINIVKPEKYYDYWKKLKIAKSYSTADLSEKKHEIKLLKSNALHFDKTYKNILRHKNWWKINP